MTESKTAIYNAAAFLTVAKFGTEYNIAKEDKDMLMTAARALYKQNVQVKNPSGNLVPAVRRNLKSHGVSSPFLINPLAHGILLKELDNQKRLAAKRAQVVEK